MSKVWALMTGEYSDVYIVGIFSTKEVAERLADRMNSADRLSFARLEEYNLDSIADTVGFVVRVDATGKEISRWGGLGDAPEAAEGATVVPYGSGDIRVEGRSSHSFEAALKAARDKLAKVKAERQGL